MAAHFKSNIRLREEKGFGSISMKRLIFCGVGAVLIFMLVRLTPLAGLSLPALVGVFAGLLLLSSARGGLPLWQRVMLGWRGGIVLRAAKHRDGLGAHLAQVLSLNPAVVQVRGERLFAASMQAADGDPGEWTLFASLNELEGTGGLRLVEWQGGRDGGSDAAR
jgi:hypothetical protein